MQGTAAAYSRQGRPEAQHGLLHDAAAEPPPCPAPGQPDSSSATASPHQRPPSADLVLQHVRGHACRGGGMQGTAEWPTTRVVQAPPRAWLAAQLHPSWAPPGCSLPRHHHPTSDSCQGPCRAPTYRLPAGLSTRLALLYPLATPCLSEGGSMEVHQLNSSGHIHATIQTCIATPSQLPNDWWATDATC
jgi:hypothetical protein